jgi:hypothetical protein
MSIAPRTGSQQVFSYGGRLKLVDIAIPVLSDFDAAEFVTFFRNLRGQENTFNLDLTYYYPDEDDVSSVAMRLLNPEQAWEVRPPMLYEITLSAIEAR